MKKIMVAALSLLIIQSPVAMAELINHSASAETTKPEPYTEASWQSYPSIDLSDYVTTSYVCDCTQYCPVKERSHKITLRMYVNEAGRVIRTKVLEGTNNSKLDYYVARQVKYTARLNPFVKNGVPISGTVAAPLKINYEIEPICIENETSILETDRQTSPETNK